MEDLNLMTGIEADNTTGAELANIDITDTNIKINPNFYIHVALLKAQSALSNVGNIQDNILNYCVMVEHVEALSKAAKHVVTKDYDEKIKEFEESDLYKNENNGRLKLAMLANKKLKLLTEGFFTSMPLTGGLRYTIPRTKGAVLKANVARTTAESYEALDAHRAKGVTCDEACFCWELEKVLIRNEPPKDKGASSDNI